MFTVKRVIDGDRISTEHEKVRLGDRKSRVFREALRLLEIEHFELVADEMTVRPAAGAKRIAADKPDPDTMHLSDYCSWSERSAESPFEGYNYIRQLLPNIVLPEYTRVSVIQDKGYFIRSVAHDAVENAILVLHGSRKLLQDDIDYLSRELKKHGVSPDKFFDVSPSPDSDMSFIIYTRVEMETAELDGGCPMEFTDVQEQLQWVGGESVITVLKGARHGDRGPDDLIGAMYIAEEASYDDENNRSVGGMYELFYKGDEVYVVNTHGKTTDVLK